MTTLRILSVSLMMAVTAACNHHTSIADARVLARDSHSELGGELSVEQLDENVWRHISHQELPEVGRVASNGLLVVADEGLILIDTPWTTDQSRRLMEWSRRTFGHDIHDVIITHAHDDRFGGAAPLASSGAIFHAIPLTISKIREQGTALEVQALSTDSELELLGESLAVLFPGAGHAPDNIVVWLPSEGILFGGCMVRAETDHELGNVQDADISSWSRALNVLAERYSEASIVVPGHGEPGGPELFRHTRELVSRTPATTSN